MTNTDRQKKVGAFGVSLLIHGLLLFFIATMTLDLTMPEGTVSEGTMEFTVAPKGSQVETPNVAAVAQPEVPEKIKSKPAPPPPPPKPQKVEKVETSDVEPDPIGALPIEEEAAPPTELPDKIADEPDTTSKVESMKEVETPPETEDKPIEQAPPVPVAVPGNSPSAAPQESGADQLNLKGQDKVADQTYGRSDGVRNAQILTPLPGNKKPEYPFMARFRRVEGNVVVQFSVASDGTISNLRLVSSNNEMFTKPVMDAVKTWRFRSPVDAGEYYHQFNFILKGEAQEIKSRLRRKE